MPKRKPEQGRGTDFRGMGVIILNMGIKLILIVKGTSGRRFEGGGAVSLPM